MLQRIREAMAEGEGLSLFIGGDPKNRHRRQRSTTSRSSTCPGISRSSTTAGRPARCPTLNALPDSWAAPRTSAHVPRLDRTLGLLRPVPTRDAEQFPEHVLRLLRMQAHALVPSSGLGSCCFAGGFFGLPFNVPIATSLPRESREQEGPDRTRSRRWLTRGLGDKTATGYPRHDHHNQPVRPNGGSSTALTPTIYQASPVGKRLGRGRRLPGPVCRSRRRPKCVRSAARQLFT
jgi:hypothetical protein